ncbi:hypothetical protein C8R46DRAFT_1341852 [Mycena filopes]|nr:hypothetical protein C8R46DRAFT_1341852 [Mycena filopes]
MPSKTSTQELSSMSALGVCALPLNPFPQTTSVDTVSHQPPHLLTPRRQPATLHQYHSMSKTRKAQSSPIPHTMNLPPSIDIIHPAAPPPLRVRPIALPALLPGVETVTLNPLLRLEAESAIIDVNFESWMGNPGTHSQTEGLMDEAATLPGLPSLTLISACFPWPITAHAAGTFLVVGDVLHAVRRALALRISEEEVDEWMESQERRSRAGKRKRAYYSGMTRMALLQGASRFCGLSESNMGYDVWQLHFS